jgi:hypothetical protein
VRPDQLAGLAVERDDRTARAAGCVEDAVDGERRTFELVLRTRPETVGLESPGHLELVVGAVDLIEGDTRAFEVRIVRQSPARDGSRAEAVAI